MVWEQLQIDKYLSDVAWFKWEVIRINENKKIFRF